MQARNYVHDSETERKNGIHIDRNIHRGIEAQFYFQTRFTVYVNAQSR